MGQKFFLGKAYLECEAGTPFGPVVGGGRGGGGGGGGSCPSPSPKKIMEHFTEIKILATL